MPSLYIHVPFCDGKCPYCDFYSLWGDAVLMDRFIDELCRRLARWKGRRLAAETVYFGGGTPNLLGAKRLGQILAAARESFSLAPEAEITLEANPTQVDRGFFREVRAAGFNRLSLGLQSANGAELRFLGRRHTPEDAARAVADARAAGFANLSLDLMLALPGSDLKTLGASVDFAASLEPEHLSAYLLKVEPGTPFAARGVEPLDEDAAADQYLFLVEELARRGYAQYEISNFARPGRESRHNLVYWRDQEYLGFGPGAHSFLGGRRFFDPRNLEGFLQGGQPVDDGLGGDFEEFVMLGLRLTEGISRARSRERFGEAGAQAFDRLLIRAGSLPPDLVTAEEDRVALTPRGFLVSNALLRKLLAE